MTHFTNNHRTSQKKIQFIANVKLSLERTKKIKKTGHVVYMKLCERTRGAGRNLIKIKLRVYYRP